MFSFNLTAEGCIPAICTRWLRQNTSFLHESWFSSEVTWSRSLNWMPFLLNWQAFFQICGWCETFFQALESAIRETIFLLQNLQHSSWRLLDHQCRFPCDVSYIWLILYTPFPIWSTVVHIQHHGFPGIHFRIRAMSAWGCSMEQRSVMIQ